MLAAGLLCVSGSARANDSTCGGSGHDLPPLAHAQVEMRSEDVVIQFQPRSRSWAVTAHYVFRNKESVEARVQVGFPELRCESNDDSDCANRAFVGLETR